MNILNRYRLLLAASLITILCAGCAGQPIRVGFLDPSMDTIDFTKGRHIEAEASGFQLLLFIPIGVNDRHAKAYGILQSQAGTDYITDVKVKESWTYALVGTIYTTTLEAMAYPRIAAAVPASQPAPAAAPASAPAAGPNAAPTAAPAAAPAPVPATEPGSAPDAAK
jgi:hypothetical protein